MARVTRRGGVVAACVWDHGDGGSGPLSLFWAAVRQLDPQARDESGLAGSREGHLAELFEQAGLRDVRVVSAHRAGRTTTPSPSGGNPSLSGSVRREPTSRALTQTAAPHSRPAARSCCLRLRSS